MRQRLVIVGLAVLVRLLCLALFDPVASLHSGDSALFLAGAEAQAPGYPAFLSVAPAPLFVQSIATILVALLALTRLPRGGFIAALLIATSPFFVAFEWRILSDSLGWQLVFTGFLLIAFPQSKWEVVLAGVLLGSAALVRDTYQWLPLFALLFAILFSAERRKQVGAAAVIAYLVILPWQLSQTRLAISEGRMGYNLWVGTWERDADWMANGIDRANYPANAFSSPQQRHYLFELPLFTSLSDERFTQAAIDRITIDPVGTISTWIVRYPRLWLGTRSDQIAWRISSGPLWLGAKAGLWALNALLLALGALGILLHWRRYPLLITPIAYVALVYLPFHNSETRYSLGALPFIAVFAALAIQHLAERFERINRQPAHARPSP